MLSIYEQARKEFEKYYDYQMSVEVSAEIKKGAITRQEKQIILENVPCRLSKSANGQVKDDINPKIDYVTKLFCSPEINIPPGSIIEVTDVYGRSLKYKRSSESFFYHTHQEMIVERSDSA